MESIGQLAPTRPGKKRKNGNESPTNGELETNGNVRDATLANDAYMHVYEARSCENCRRCKLKCSRTNPCTKCAAKGTACLYEDDKKRGPRPGYIEELNRRVNDLENMVLGQSMLLNLNREPGKKMGFSEVIESMREELTASGIACSQESRESETSQSPHQDLNDIERQRGTIDEPPSEQFFRRFCDVYNDQVQPWIPVLHRPSLYVAVTMAIAAPREPLPPVLQAVIAASCPLIDGPLAKHKKYYSQLEDRVFKQLLASANMGVLQAAVVLIFLMFGNGNIADHWGLVALVVQLALQAGLHLEDEQLSDSHREYRRLIKFGDSGDNWVTVEGTRRLFWTIFLLDQFAAVYSGIGPNISTASIRRRLPSDGQKWHDDQPVQTREFVPATAAISLQLSIDSNIGGVAYLLEATEIMGMINSFALNTAKTGMPEHDPQGFLQEFLNLDLLLTNWKSRLPPRYQRASYNEDGYMDHNLTLAHLSHNTSVILLYQTSRLLHRFGVNNEQAKSSWRSQLGFVKQAAKEVAKICTRFLLHRRYLVSPQFIFCQFIAARALLAYSRWTLEPLDEDYETLHTSLVESFKRWNGLGASHESTSSPGVLNDFASKLLARLAVDFMKGDEIDLTTPCTHLLMQPVQQGVDFQSTEFRTGLRIPSFESMSGQSQRSNSMQPEKTIHGEAQYSDLLEADPIDPNVDAFFKEISGVVGVMDFLHSDQFERVGSRIFSWQDC